MFQLVSQENFQEVYPVLKEAFSVKERRTKEHQKALLTLPQYCLYAVREQEQLQGIVALWEIEDFIYIEHFAISPEFRNGGFGGKVLESIIEWKNKPVILEVEEPKNDMQKRRIGFYERHGFFCSDYPYMQPPLRENHELVSLVVMTRPRKIEKEEFEIYKRLLYKIVYQYEDK